MAAIGAYLGANILNVSLKISASLVSPATLGVGICIGVPTSISMSEVGTGSSYTPQSVTFSSVSTGGSLMSATNANALTFSFASANTVSGCVIKDTLSASAASGNLGHIYYFAALSTAVTLAASDTITFAAGALTVSLS